MRVYVSTGTWKPKSMHSLELELQAIVSSLPKAPGPECDSQHPHTHSQGFGGWSYSSVVACLLSIYKVLDQDPGGQHGVHPTLGIL